MIDNDIIKALECCLNRDCKKSPMEICDPCPYFHEGNCTDLLKENALNLINRQKAEIEMLNKTIESLQATVREINRYFDDKVAEAIREFVEGFTQKAEWRYLATIDCVEYRIMARDLKRLVEEMTGGKNRNE